MTRRSKLEAFATLYLAQALQGEVEGWANQGWPGVTQTTYELLSYWFNRDEEAEERFYNCQRRAIETIIYCHEVLQTRTLLELYERLAPEALLYHAPLKEEVESIPFPKYCLKMATGSGKTWVLAALLVWQYFNVLRNERPGDYSYRFLIVAPGRDVLNRLLDSFRGKKDPRTGQRDSATSDYSRSLFMPEGARWRDQFHVDVLEPEDVRANTTPPEGPFAFLTNWQQFRLSSDKSSLWEQYTGEDVEEQPRGEVIAGFLSEYPDLVVMNDEAHHVHGKKTAKNEELVWRRFMNVLYERLSERHQKKRGLFLQIDYSATPFYGSGTRREYFPHIVYDYDLVQAMRDMLVKQLFLEERQSVAGEKLEDLDFRAERMEGENKRGQVKALSAGQKLLLEIGRRKLEQLALEFRERGIQRKPVLMVLAEETEVAELVAQHFATLSDENGQPYDERQIMVIHSKLKEKQLKEARRRLDRIDDDNDPLRVVISVLMLREGFDKTNICVTVVLRATEADLLLEQIVGRGLRQMFPRAKYPEFWDAKVEAIEDIRRNRTPSNSLDFLFIIEHPRFRAFYEELRRQGYLIGSGDTSTARSTGDLIPVDAIPIRIPKYDIAWPVQVFEQGKLPDLSRIDVSTIPPYQGDFEQLRQMLRKLAITDVHVETGAKARTWKLDNRYFDYSFFLRQAAHAVATQGKTALLTGLQAEIAALIDEYVSNYLFGQQIDFGQSENYTVLNFPLVYDHVVNQVRRAILETVESSRYELRQGAWKRLSDLKRITVREKRSIETAKCIYPRQNYSATGGGFERDFMLEVLNPSAEVQAFAKLEHKHDLIIYYRDEDGIQRKYEVDFIVRAPEAIYLVETKGDRDLDKPEVALKARAAQAWCANAFTVLPPNDLHQPQQWEYLILSEGLFKENRGLSFGGLVPLCRGLRDRIITTLEEREAQKQGRLL